MEKNEIVTGLRDLMALWDTVEGNVKATLPHLSEASQAAIVSALMTLWIKEGPNQPD